MGRCDPGQDGRVTHRRAPALAAPKLAHQVAEAPEIVGLVGDQEVHVVDPDALRQELADLRILVADPDVLVHHPLARLTPEQVVPGGALGERIDDNETSPR